MKKECWEKKQEHIWQADRICSKCGAKMIIGGYTAKYLIKYLGKK